MLSKPKPKTIWDLHRDGLTQGAINQFLACREQFYLSYVLGWTPKTESEAMAFGSDFHAVLAEQHCCPQPFDDLLTVHFRKIQDKQRFWSADDLSDLSLRQATLGIVLDAYTVFWKKEDEKRIWRFREQTFNVEYPFDAMNPIPLRGRFDGVFDKKGLWLLETKTKSQIDEDGLQNSLHLDVQSMFYAFAIWSTTGTSPVGIVYDVVRRPSLRRKEGESFTDFTARLQKDIKSRPEHYFKRWKIVLAKDDLLRWEREFLFPVLRAIKTWWSAVSPLPTESRWRAEQHYMSPAALFNRYGKCSLFHAITNNNYQHLKRRKQPFPELED